MPLISPLRNSGEDNQPHSNRNRYLVQDEAAFSAVDTVARETVASPAQKLGCGGRVVSIRFDMRAPVRGAAVMDNYATAIDLCAWAEQRACRAAVFCEHHGSEDGYLPASPILASAIAARVQLPQPMLTKRTER